MDEHRPVDPEISEKELIALSRLLTYARDTARGVQAHSVEYCLEMALAAAAKELSELRGDAPFSVEVHLRAGTLQ